MPTPTPADLAWLLALIQGTRWPFSPGLTSWKHADPAQQELHEACLLLERQGHIVRFQDTEAFTVWTPIALNVPQRDPAPLA